MISLAAMQLEHTNRIARDIADFIRDDVATDPLAVVRALVKNALLIEAHRHKLSPDEAVDLITRTVPDIAARIERAVFNH